MHGECHYVWVYTLDTRAARQILREGLGAKDKLLAALHDPERYAAADFLLAKITHQSFPVLDAGPNFTFSRAGISETHPFEPADMPALQKKWRDYFGKQLQSSISDVPKNSAVFWDGNISGLDPILESSEAQQIRKEGITAKEKLLAALADPDRYVAAHVLLTRIANKRFKVSGRQWNELHVILHADSTVTYDPKDMYVLQRKWRDYFETN